MCDPAGQLSDSIELLHLQQLRTGLLERFLRPQPLSDVARDFGEAYEDAVFADRIDDHARPKEAPVLADAPALFLVLAVVRGGLEGPLRLAFIANNFDSIASIAASPMISRTRRRELADQHTPQAIAARLASSTKHNYLRDFVLGTSTEP